MMSAERAASTAVKNSTNLMLTTTRTGSYLFAAVIQITEGRVTLGTTGPLSGQMIMMKMRASFHQNL